MRALALACGLLLAAAPALAGPVTLRPNPVDDDGRVTFGDVFDGAGAASNTVIADRAGPSVVFEASQLQGLAVRAGLQWGNPMGLRRVVVRQGAPQPVVPSATQSNVATRAASPAAPSAARLAAARPGASVEILAYARNINVGDVVQPEDVVWSTVQAHQAPSGAPRDADQVIGLSARRALRAGAAVAVRDLTAPQVIARNDMVEVAFLSGGVKLTITGRATRDAALGESVPVMNPSSNRTIDAVAVGPGRAVTGPAAQAARANPLQFAAR